MDVLCLIALIYLFGQCNGTFSMMYKKKEEEILLPCKRDGLQIDLDQDNKIDCYCNVTDTSVKCQNVSLGFQLKKEHSGFFACVNFSTEAQTTQWLFPFKPKDQVDVYIVALIEPKLTSAGTITNSVSKITGDTFHLFCNFTMPVKRSYNVFWIKTSTERQSSCLHSYSLAFDHKESYDFHCLIDKNLHHRLSTSKSEVSESQLCHHLTIRNTTPADSGQYECILQVDTKWKIITNITVTVYMKDSIIQISGGKPLLVLYVISALVLFCLFITAIVMHVRKTEWLSKGSQHIRKKRDQNGKDSLTSECSPYNVGWRDEVIYSLANLPEGGDILVCTQTSDKEDVELNPILVKNILYEASTQMDTLGLEPQYESVA